MIGDDTKCEFS